MFCQVCWILLTIEVLLMNNSILKSKNNQIIKSRYIRTNIFVGHILFFGHLFLALISCQPVVKFCDFGKYKHILQAFLISFFLLTCAKLIGISGGQTIFYVSEDVSTWQKMSLGKEIKCTSGFHPCDFYKTLLHNNDLC